jgi:hypothetical protein
MDKAAPASSRVFKTAWFAKAARKARIGDIALCEAIRQVAVGQADDLGGGVFKKRLNKNEHRAIILAKAGELWILECSRRRIERTLTTTSWPSSASSQRPIAG